VVEMQTDTNHARPPGCLFVNMRTSPSHLGSATRVRVAALREGARAIYADWVEGAKQRGEIASGVSTAVAAAFLDTQCTSLIRVGQSAKTFLHSAKLTRLLKITSWRYLH
jgi:hypothetical protein